MANPFHKHTELLDQPWGVAVSDLYDQIQSVPDAIVACPCCSWPFRYGDLMALEQLVAFAAAAVKSQRTARDALEVARACVLDDAEHDQACNQALRHLDGALEALGAAPPAPPWARPTCGSPGPSEGEACELAPDHDGDIHQCTRVHVTTSRWQQRR